MVAKRRTLARMRVSRKHTSIAQRQRRMTPEAASEVPVAVLQRAIQDPSPVVLTPDVVQTLQRTHGNQFVAGLVQRARAKNAPGAHVTQRTDARIQRIGGSTRYVHPRAPGTDSDDDTGVELTGQISDMVGHTGDWMGTDPSKGLAMTGPDSGTGNALTGMGTSSTMQGVAGGISIGTGGLGVGLSSYAVHQNRLAHAEAVEKLAFWESKVNLDGVKASIALWKRRKAAATRGIFEGIGGILGGLSGLTNGVAGMINVFANAGSALANVSSAVAGVAFGVGAGLGALVSLINGIREFFRAGKRSKAKNVITETYEAIEKGYGERETSLVEKQTKYNDISNEVITLTGQLATANRAKTRTIRAALRQKNTQMQALSNEIAPLETSLQTLDQSAVGMVQGLKVAARKQGFGGKIFGGIVNLVGAAGGAALLAATIGGVAAAAGPVGWILGGIALVATLSYFIGTKVKQAIRKSNVERMRTEITLVREFIDTGKANGQQERYNGHRYWHTKYSKTDRENVKWERAFFEAHGVQKKGLFRRMFTKSSKSGVLTMGERLAELEAYLLKYDKEAAGEATWDGIVAALTTAEGDVTVPNPKFDQAKADKDPNYAETKEITLKQNIINLLTHFFKGKTDDIIESIKLAPTSKRHINARQLVLEKLKLADKGSGGK